MSHETRTVNTKYGGSLGSYAENFEERVQQDVSAWKDFTGRFHLDAQNRLEIAGLMLNITDFE